MIYHVTVGDRTFQVDLGSGGVTVDGRTAEVDFARIQGGPVRSLVVDGVSHRLAARRVGTETWDLHIRGRRVRADVVDERTRVIREMTGTSAGVQGPRPVIAPMPGMVVKIEVEKGQVVRAGQGVVIVEAMKMENELAAEADGRVERIHVEAGQAVDKDQLLVELAPLDAEGDE